MGVDALLIDSLLENGDPTRAAVIGPDGVVTTYAQLRAHVNALAAWIEDRTQPGDRVAVIADNGVEYATLYYAVPRAGRVLAFINQRLGTAEQAAMVRAADPTIVFGDERHVTSFTDVDAPALRVAFGSADWDAAISSGRDCPHIGVPDDPAFLLFTSGSTGSPKGVVHTNRSIVTAVAAGVVCRGVTADAVYLLPFPMCHIAGYNVLVHHAAGATVVLETHFRPDRFVSTIAAQRVTSCSLAPTMIHSLLSHLEESGATVPSLRSIAYGSAAISQQLLAKATGRLAVELHQGYGMTETGGNVTFLTPADHAAGARDPEILRTVGAPHPDVEVRVVADDGTDVAAGRSGEILVRGRQVMVGYWNDPEATADAFVDGWLRTGDVGRFDAEDRLAIVDRRKDVIVTGGENVSSREVEDALTSHPAVSSVAVVGVPDDYWGEAICAVVVLVPGAAPDPDGLIAHVRASISPFKRPRHVLFVDDLPLTTNGKVAKQIVREMARAATAPTAS